MESEAQVGLTRLVVWTALAGYALAWAQLVPAGFVMDDYFFHHYLHRLGFWEALGQRLSGNWNFEFTQAPMYRPVAGVVQVAAHAIFGVFAPAHRMLSLAL